MELADKPGSVTGPHSGAMPWRNPASSHSSTISVAEDLQRPTRIRRGPRHRIPIWPCSGRGLPSHPCYHARGALLPHPFTLTAYPSGSRRSTLCCTFRKLTLPRRYLAPCPVEPGLSSRGAKQQLRPPAAAWPARTQASTVREAVSIGIDTRHDPGIALAPDSDGAGLATASAAPARAPNINASRGPNGRGG